MIRTILYKYCLGCRISSVLELISIDDVKLGEALVRYKCKNCKEIREYLVNTSPDKTMDEIKLESEKNRAFQTNRYGE